MQQNGETLYARYCRAGRRFEIIGGAVLAVAAAAHRLTGGHAVTVLAGIAGLALLVFGAMNMRPANMIKAFAMQLHATCDRDFAQGLLEAMEKDGKTLLSGRAIANLHQAIYMYEKSKDADAALVEKLRAAAEKHVRKMPF